MVYRPLPKFVVISSSHPRKYYGPTGPNGHVNANAVQLHGTDNLKHEVVKSVTYPGLIHLKCLDTGKYWSWGQNRVSGGYICAQQTSPVVDLSSNACTLIKYSSDTTNGVTSFHLQFRWNSKWHYIMKQNAGYLISGTRTNQWHHFIIKDWHKADRTTNNKKNTIIAGGGGGGGGSGGGGGGSGGASTSLAIGKQIINFNLRIF